MSSRYSSQDLAGMGPQELLELLGDLARENPAAARLALEEIQRECEAAATGEWLFVGSVAVDAGCVAIVAQEEAPSVPSPSEVDPGGVGVDLFRTHGVEAVVIPSGMGDGRYPVEVKVMEIAGRVVVSQARIVFIEEDE